MAAAMSIHTQLLAHQHLQFLLDVPRQSLQSQPLWAAAAEAVLEQHTFLIMLGTALNIQMLQVVLVPLAVLVGSQASEVYSPYQVALAELEAQQVVEAILG
jgi:hypothetical protein